MIVLLLMACGMTALPVDATLENDGVCRLVYGFQHPQDSCRTKVWWFHGQTTTTREGITADLEAFKRAGVGGVVFYDQVHGTAPAEALKGLSPQWWRMLIFAAQEAKRLGLSFESNISNGYVAGGRWITPRLGMQRLAWTEKVVEGGGDVTLTIPVVRPRLNYYGDIAVLAIPYTDSLTAETSFTGIPVVRRGDSVAVSLDAGKTITVRSLRYSMRARGKAKTSAMNVPCIPGPVYQGTGYTELPAMGELLASSDGKTYTAVCRLKPVYRDLGGSREKTLSFPAVRARFFRLSIHDWWSDRSDDTTLVISSATLSARACVDEVETKNGSYSDYITTDRTPDYSSEEILHRKDVVDLTLTRRGDTIVWHNAPKGRWLVMRFYHEPTGAKSKHGRPELLGLECDKMSRLAADVQWDNYAKPVIDSIRANGANICGIVMDSHEQGPQNWTAGFEKAFRRRNGYDMIPLLPVMAGLVEDSRQESLRFLFDLRHTIADMIRDNYFAHINDLCHKSNVTLTAQAIGNGQSIVTDQIAIKSVVDKPQGEFWAHHPDGNYDIKDCSSAAHIYNKVTASGEAFTDARYDQPLSYIKQLADAAYAFGINEFVVCASAYQPWQDRVPGNTADGRQYCLNRNNTYWQMSRPFWDYQARCAFMLRQGKPVADFALYLGDDVPMKIMANRLPPLPKGFDFDALTTDALDGRVRRYKAVLTGRRALVTPKARARIDSLRQTGVLFWDGNGNEALIDFLSKNNIRADVLVPQDRKTYTAHRKTESADIFFIDNHEDSGIDWNYGFNTPYRHAELWDAVTGRRERLTVQRSNNYAVIALSLSPRQSAFVVFTNACDSSLALYSPHPDYSEQVIGGKWTVNFNTKMGGPEKAVFKSLTDWAQSDDDRVKYFSGTAVYRNKFKVDRQNGKTCMLSFDRLCDIAHVIVNGEDAGFVWCSPYQLDITSFIRQGSNDIAIEVANSLYNRMIGDLKLPEGKRYTWATKQLVSTETPLKPSGIIGNVTLHWQ